MATRKKAKRPGAYAKRVSKVVADAHREQSLSAKQIQDALLRRRVEAKAAGEGQLLAGLKEAEVTLLSLL